MCNCKCKINPSTGRCIKKGGKADKKPQTPSKRPAKNDGGLRKKRVKK